MKNIHQKKVEEKIAADEEEKRKVEDQKVLFEWIFMVFTFWGFSVWFLLLFPKIEHLRIVGEKIFLCSIKEKRFSEFMSLNKGALIAVMKVSLLAGLRPNSEITDFFFGIFENF